MIKYLAILIALVLAPLARGQSQYPTSYQNGGQVTASIASGTDERHARLDRRRGDVLAGNTVL